MATLKTRKVNARFTEEDLELLKELAEAQGVTLTDALRRALRTATWLRRLKAEQKRLIVRDEAEGTEKEVVLAE